MMALMVMEVAKKMDQVLKLGKRRKRKTKMIKAKV